MFPLIAIGGAISAVASVIKGASWVSDKLSSSGSAATSGKDAARPESAAKASPFEAALAAQGAGQTLPGSGTRPAAATSAAQATTVPPSHVTDYDTVARMKAGMAAYTHIGERHGNHAGAAIPPGTDEDKPITRA
jgi:hypothetical protein